MCRNFIALKYLDFVSPTFLHLIEIWVEICYKYNWHNSQTDRCMGVFKPEFLNKPGHAVLWNPTPFATYYKFPNTYLYISEFFIFLLVAIRSIHKITGTIKAFKTSNEIYSWKYNTTEKTISFWWAWGRKFRNLLLPHLEQYCRLSCFYNE